MECSVNGCDASAETKGMCIKHYTRFIRYGNTSTVLRPRGEARKFFYTLLSLKREECVSWPFTTSGREKRPWVSLEGKRRGYVSRFLCEKIHGPAPLNKNQAAHSCGNEKCVNPNHLRWASPKENAADKITHGTVARGEKQGSSKLKEADVRKIRELAGAIPNTEIAKIFGVGDMQVGRIIRRERWKHLD